MQGSEQTSSSNPPPTIDAAPQMDAVVTVRGLSKTYRRKGGELVAAIDGIDFVVKRGEFVVLLGPSGCGKTTLLRCVAGLERPEAGVIEIRRRRVVDAADTTFVQPAERRVSMVFQSYALWPHMTASQTVAYPLRSRGVDRRTARERVAQILEMVGIPELADQYPAQMSGGQQQRVALARALVDENDLILFDEPLSNVDARVREDLRRQLLEMHRRLGFSAIYVTHDQVEALELADRVAVMRSGRIEQSGPPREVYEWPASRYVADFMGSMNGLDGTVTTLEQGHIDVETPLGRVRCDRGAGAVDVERFEAGSSVTVLCRRDECRLISRRPRRSENVWPATVESAVFIGSQVDYIVRVGNLVLTCRLPSQPQFAEGSEVWLTVDPSSTRLVPSATQHGQRDGVDLRPSNQRTGATSGNDPTTDDD